MKIQWLFEKWKQFIIYLHDRGIPVPLIRDNGVGSVSLTLLFISSLYVQVGLIGKYSKMLETIDIGQALNFFMVCSGLYFSRKISKDGKGGATLDEKAPPTPPSDPTTPAQ